MRVTPSTSSLLATALLERQAGSLKEGSDPAGSFPGCVALVSHPVWTGPSQSLTHLPMCTEHSPCAREEIREMSACRNVLAGRLAGNKIMSIKPALKLAFEVSMA